MNPLHPPVMLLRKIARELADNEDPAIRAWVDDMSRRFSSVSIVKTYRLGRLCGYEVWRHLKSSMEDPKRRKARLWFGLRPKGIEGQERGALTRAKRAAKWLADMSERELHSWWEHQQQQRRETIRGLRGYNKDSNGTPNGWEAYRILRGHFINLRFGVAHWQNQLGYAGAARDMAEKAARRLHQMKREELLAWWADHQQRREKLKATKRQMADKSMINLTELKKMSRTPRTTKRSTVSSRSGSENRDADSNPSMSPGDRISANSGVFEIT